MDFDHDHDLEHEHDIEPVEAYCVHCRESVEMESPVAVWTRRGMPATRGECPICGGVVFRMGKSAVHDQLDTPEGATRVKLTRETVYLDFAAEDVVIAEQLAAEFERVGVECWLHESEPAHVNWASGVHPALNTCTRMIFVLSEAALADARVEEAWRYFRVKNKPIVIAQIDSAAPPDDLRRRPRFDFAQDYRAAFRQMLAAIHDGR